MRRTAAFSIILIFIMGVIAIAQPGMGLRQDRPFRSQRMDRDDFRGRVWERIPDLTEDQEGQLEKLQLDYLKAVKDVNNALTEKHAELRTLSTADKADMAKINSKIDEIGKLKTELMKEREKHHQAVRNILTDEQRVVFDAMGPGMRGGRHGKGMRGRGFNGRSMGGPGPGPCMQFQD